MQREHRVLVPELLAQPLEARDTLLPNRDPDFQLNELTVEKLEEQKHSRKMQYQMAVNPYPPAMQVSKPP